MKQKLNQISRKFFTFKYTNITMYICRYNYIYAGKIESTCVQWRVCIYLDEDKQAVNLCMMINRQIDLESSLRK